MARKRQKDTHDQIEAQIAAAGSIGGLERLAGLGSTQEERAEFWAPFCKLSACESLDEGVAELKRRIRARAPQTATQREEGVRRHA